MHNWFPNHWWQRESNWKILFIFKGSLQSTICFFFLSDIKYYFPKGRFKFLSLYNFQDFFHHLEIICINYFEASLWHIFFFFNWRDHFLDTLVYPNDTTHYQTVLFTYQILDFWRNTLKYCYIQQLILNFNKWT